MRSLFELVKTMVFRPLLGPLSCVSHYRRMCKYLL